MASGPLLALLIALLVAQDAKRRGMNAVAWGVGVFFLVIIVLPLYFIYRKPRIRYY